jgi:hypothetical protein
MLDFSQPHWLGGLVVVVAYECTNHEPSSHKNGPDIPDSESGEDRDARKEIYSRWEGGFGSGDEIGRQIRNGRACSR